MGHLLQLHVSIFLMLFALMQCSSLPRCFRSTRPDQFMCREILSSNHTFAQILETEHPVNNNDVEGIIELSSKFIPPIPAECLDSLVHLVCLVALPPCSLDSGLPVLICEDQCTLYQQIQQAGLCKEVENRFETVRLLTNSGDFEALLGAYLSFNCSDPSTFFFMNVSESELDDCTSIFSPHFESLFMSQLCELGIGPNCHVVSTAATTNRAVEDLVVKAVLPPVMLVLLAATITLLLLLTCYLRHRRRKLLNHQLEMDEEILKMIKRSEPSQRRQETAVGKTSDHFKNKFSNITISYHSLTIGQVIGKGAFGKVFKGNLAVSGDLKGKTVAIKTIKNLQDTDLESFLSEGVVMKGFSHPNVLGLVGVVFDTPDGTPHLVLPFMENGNLKTFLKSRRGKSSKVDSLPKDLKLCNLVKMCVDVAQGMEYLAEQLVVHRDLAARNCMLDKDLLVKVGDFGLTRDVYTTDYYRTSDKSAKLPVKWMPPETFNDGISNEKTDIWAFGVTCWEVFSLGRTPYPVVTNSEIFTYISKGGRLEKPALCPQEIFDEMSQCWEQRPEKRPKFVEVAQTLSEYWDDKYGYL